MKLVDWLSPARQIPPEWRPELDAEVAWTLFVRTRALAAALVVFNILILAVVDLRHWLAHWNRGQANLTMLHVAMLAVAATILLVGRIRRPTGHATLAPWHRVAASALPLASLLWGAAIAVNAQLLHHEITAYVASLLVVAVSVPLAPSRSLWMIAASFAAFFGGLALVPVPTWTRESHFLNSSAVAVVAWVLSALFYGARVRDFLNRRTIARQRDELDTAREREEQQRIGMKRLEGQRLESLGLLAGGVAHDFNNLLGAIRTNMILAETDLSADSAARVALQDAQLAAQRAAELANQMLAYSGRGHFQVQPVDLSETVSEMARLAASSVSKRCALTLEVGRDLPAVEADLAQLRQVVLNLITNGAEALGDRAGKVVVRTGVRDCPNAELAQGPLAGLPAGRYVMLEVTDDGCGMTPDVQARIFDPFFSTKFAGRGLGMAAVLGILRGHRGSIQVESEPGKGSTFRVLLPASTRPAQCHAAVEPQASVPSRGGRVLVVDDEELLRRGTRRYLQKVGFDVVEAKDGEECVAAFRKASADFDAVVVDLSMPGMDGLQVMRELRTIRPRVPIILTSGYTASDLAGQMDNGRLAPPDAFLQKPYYPSALVHEIQRILHTPSPGERTAG